MFTLVLPLCSYAQGIPDGSASNPWIVGPSGFPQLQPLLDSGFVLDGHHIVFEAGTYAPFDLGTIQDLKITKTPLPASLPDPSPAIIQPASPGSSNCITEACGIRIAGCQDQDTVVEGLTITGFDNSTCSSHAVGAGVSISGSTPTLRLLHVHGNVSTRGAGIHVDNPFYENACALPPVPGNPLVDPTPLPTLIQSCLVEDNVATIGGGGLYAFGGPVTVTDTTFVGNMAGANGAGVLLTNFAGDLIETSRLIDCTLSGNGDEEFPPTRGGGLFATGGINVILQDCTVDGNHARQGGGVSGLDWARLELDRCRVTGNGAETGGGLLVENGVQGRFTSTLFEGNSAWFDGGAIALINDVFDEGAHSPELFDNCLIVNNVVYDSALEGGGGAFVRNGGPRFQHCTFSGNRVGVDPTDPQAPLAQGSGGGLYSDNSGLPAVANVEIVNCIFSGDDAGFVPSPDDREIYQATFSVDASFSVWQGGIPFVCGTCPFGAAPFVAGPGTATTPNGNFYLDPNDTVVVDGGSSSVSTGLGGTTNPAGTLDTGVPDMGFHYGLAPVPERTSWIVASDSRIELPDGPISGYPTSMTFRLDAGANKGPNAGTRVFGMLGSVTGTDPGIPLAWFGGDPDAVLPVNWDVWTNFILNGGGGLYSVVAPEPFDADNDGVVTVTFDFGNVGPNAMLDGNQPLDIWHAFWVVEDLATLVPSQPSQFHRVTLYP